MMQHTFAENVTGVTCGQYNICYTIAQFSSLVQGYLQMYTEFAQPLKTLNRTGIIIYKFILLTYTYRFLSFHQAKEKKKRKKDSHNQYPCSKIIVGSKHHCNMTLKFHYTLFSLSLDDTIHHQYYPSVFVELWISFSI